MANNSGEGKADAMRSLLKAKAWIEAKRGDSGSTPLMMAAATGNRDGVKVLLEHGANIRAESSQGTTCLDMAWNNRAMQKTLTDTAARIGAGVSGSGRQRAYTCIYTDACGEKPALWWTWLYG